MPTIKEVNLDSPAFASEATTEDVKENATAEDSQAQSGTEEKEENGGQASSSATQDDVEQKVPYSRMATVIEQRREAERRAMEAEERLQELLSRRDDSRESRSVDSNDLPSWWLQMYGDTENSRKAYAYELERQQFIKDEARREALEAVRQERAQESQNLSQNESTLDERLAELSEIIGRDLTEDEEAAVLDIVDEYTPEDSNGKYAGELIPFDKAWEIYELRQSRVSEKTKRSRATPTALTSARTDGEVTGNDKNNERWDPRDWNAWKRKIPN